MKRLLVLLMLGIGISSFSQNIVFNSKYFEMCEFNYEIDEYEITGSDWGNVRLEAFEEYFIIKWEDESEKVWWEFNEEESSEDVLMYYTQDEEEKLVFDGSEDEIYMYGKYNNRTDRYEELIILSKIELKE